ncbi:hypothetical protein ACJX0J_020017, partial [Zea mays]
LQMHTEGEFMHDTQRIHESGLADNKETWLLQQQGQRILENARAGDKRKRPAKGTTRAFLLDYSCIKVRKPFCFDMFIFSMQGIQQEKDDYELSKLQDENKNY